MLCFFDSSLVTWVKKKQWCGFDWRRLLKYDGQKTPKLTTKFKMADFLLVFAHGFKRLFCACGCFTCVYQVSCTSVKLFFWRAEHLGVWPSCTATPIDETHTIYSGLDC